MTSTAIQHNPITPAAEALIDEIEQTLLGSRARRADDCADLDHAFTADELIAHERSVMLDATLALLIRHRLPIDADAATRAVRETEAPDVRTWATGCAEHIRDVADARQAEKRSHHG